MSTRILIISNLCLFVALIFALNRPAEIVQLDPPESKPRVEKEAVRQSETAVLSALPKPRKSTTRGSRLVKLQRLLMQIEHKERSGLYRLQSELMAKDRSGFYDTKIERQLIDYKIGELGGDDPTRWMFPWGDGGVYSRALILEGWAHAHPGDALAWWAKLGPGKRRDSLLPPLVQGYLSAEGSNWRTLVPMLSGEELAGAAIPMLEAAIADKDPDDLIELFEDEFGGTESKHPYRLVGAINDHFCEKGSYADLKNWYDTRKDENSFGTLSSDRYLELVRAIGAKGGAEALGFLPKDERMRAARAWVVAEPLAAKKWLKASPRDDGSDEVAFYLAIESVTTDTEKSREWSELIADEHLAETIDGIISGYEDR